MADTGEAPTQPTVIQPSVIMPTQSGFGRAKVVVDCNGTTATSTYLAPIEAVAARAGFTASCGSVGSSARAELVVDGSTVPMIRNVLQDKRPQMGQFGPITDADGRVRMQIDRDALNQALDFTRVTFERHALNSGISQAVGKLTGQYRLPVRIVDREGRAY